LVAPLPKIYSLKIAEDTFGESYTTQQLVYRGLIPALVFTRSPKLPSWTVDEKAQFDDIVIRKAFLSFFNAEASLVHPDLLPFMDTLGRGKVLWIMSQMHMVFAGLADHFAASEMGRQLHDLCNLMANFVDPKYQSGDGFEFLFACAFLLRVGAGYFCEPFFRGFSPSKPWSFSYNRFLKREKRFCDITTWEQLKEDIRRPASGEPHVAYYLPLHARFVKYDGFACMYTSPKKCTILAFQLKRGKDTPKKDVDEPELEEGNVFFSSRLA